MGDGRGDRHPTKPPTGGEGGREGVALGRGRRTSSISWKAAAAVAAASATPACSASAARASSYWSSASAACRIVSCSQLTYLPYEEGARLEKGGARVLVR